MSLPASALHGSQVKCRLCPRDSGTDESLVAWIKLGSMFTHHQKSVIVDGQAEGESQRRLIAFMGGLDLCDGRRAPFSPSLSLGRDEIKELNVSESKACLWCSVMGSMSSLRVISRHARWWMSARLGNLQCVLGVA